MEKTGPMAVLSSDHLDGPPLLGERLVSEGVDGQAEAQKGVGKKAKRSVSPTCAFRGRGLYRKVVCYLEIGHFDCLFPKGCPPSGSMGIISGVGSLSNWQKSHRRPGKLTTTSADATGS